MLAGWAHQLRGNQAATRAAFDSARTTLDSALKELPDDCRLHQARGLALAELGSRDEALREVRWLQRSKVYREDAYQGRLLIEDCAKILACIGDLEPALDAIEHPRFKALLVKYGSRETQ